MAGAKKRPLPPWLMKKTAKGKAAPVKTKSGGKKKK